MYGLKPVPFILRRVVRQALMGISQAAKEVSHTQPAEKNYSRPHGGVGIDLCNQVLKAAMEEWQVEDILGLGQRIQRVQ